MAQRKYKAVAGQNIFDICLMTYGSLDYLYQLIRENGLDNINSEIPLGKTFIYEETTNLLPKELVKRGIDIVTSDTILTDDDLSGAFNDDYDESYD